ncbi:MAG: hypothetical protein A2X61_15575 [Ignavibacteria bacterium GWB2_35_12]|nr:MAG: hypothetical protein A2X61_15575 [Ignavibacteria bacterium GWB2_35_12]OGU93783.1 MAG: hypothetical protein A2220_00010 [Ignavibacteria bacterium RIFOXYA2_FULL_35_10]OGV24309.1 MAG: hypothetical protein A2475_02645 [Ignavibacteria bacterium RIFOXYC2_FULL_35_21]
MSNKIYALGETVYDIIFKNGKPVSACAGGSVLNTSVSLGRCGLPVYFISEFGNDKTGRITDVLLKSNNVNTDYVYRYDDGKTKLALAFLDGNNKANYDFYKQYPSSRMNINIPDFSKDDILLFGSYFGVDSEIRKTVKQFLVQAKSANSLIVYDPNFRKAHLDELNKLKPSMIENIEYADIIRASEEDMKLIFDVDSPDEAFNVLNNKNKILIYTKGKNGVHLINNRINKFFPVPVIQTVSTIAAGDSFNAGIIYSIYKKGMTKQIINQIYEDDWNVIIQSGINFATNVCMSYDNYVSEGFVEK